MSVRARPEELEMLAELAEHTGLSKSAVLWQLVRKEHARVLGPRRPAKRSAKKGASR